MSETQVSSSPARPFGRVVLGGLMLAAAVITISVAWSMPRAFSGSLPSQQLGRIGALVYAWLVSAGLIGLGAANLLGRLRRDRRALVASLVLLVAGTPTVVLVWAVNCLLRC